jgi:hypothetical protein
MIIDFAKTSKKIKKFAFAALINPVERILRHKLRRSKKSTHFSVPIITLQAGKKGINDSS